MFASVWQLLTAIFIFSALIKIVCKLIKEDRALGCASSHSPRRRFVGVVRADQQQQQLQRLELEREQVAAQVSFGASANQANEQDENQQRADSRDEQRRHDQQQQREREREREQQEQLDEDDEFEETLSWAFQTPGERAQLEEQRRARWLTRQRFRRQLNRLNVEAAGVEELVEEVANLSPTSSGEFFDASEFSAPNQNAATQQQQQQQQQEQQQQQQPDTDPLEAGAPALSKQSARRPLLGSPLQSSNADQDDRVSRQQQANSSSRQFGRLERGQIQSEHQQQDDAFGSRQAFELTRLIIETSLLEPLKLTSAILSHTFRNFCAFLDFIEGIESAESLESPAGSVRSSVSVTSAPGASPNQLEGVAAGLELNRRCPLTVSFGAVSARSSSSRIRALDSGANEKRNQRTNSRGRSNYFHRRYVSRRSLSAALLNDSDEAPDESID